MRILIVSDQWFPDFKGGSARVAADSATRLARRGHEVTVLVPQFPGQPEVSSDGLLTLRRVLRRNPLPRTFTDLVGTRRSARKAGHFDLLLAHQATTAVGLLAARMGRPLLVVYHASMPRELRYLRSRLPRAAPDRLTTYLLEPPLRLYERVALARASGVFVLSEFSRSLVLADHPGMEPKIRYVPAGVDVEWFSPGDGTSAARARLGIQTDVPLLLTVRRLEPRMGLDELLRAVRQLIRSREVLLAIGGSGRSEASLKHLTMDLGLEERVRFLGRLSDAELRDWYRAADLFVLPSKAYEGFGMVTAESLACGTPVVGTPIGATPELLEPLEPRLVATGTSAEALAAAIAGVIDARDPKLRSRCRAYASERFDWGKALPAWEEALVEAAESGLAADHGEAATRLGGPLTRRSS